MTNSDRYADWSMWPCPTRPGFHVAKSDAQAGGATWAVAARPAFPDGHSGVRIIKISSLVSSGASRSLPGQRPIVRQPSRE